MLSPRTRRSLARLGVVRFASRAQVLWHERKRARQRPRDALRYLVRGREISNLTYELANRDDAVPFLASVLDAPPEDLERYPRELYEDEDLRAHLMARLRTRPDRHPAPRYGKRALYYCIVRSERPQVVVETGTHDGLGSAVLGRALTRNGAEGAPGELLTFDVNPDAGWLLDEATGGNVRRHVGDARETLPPPSPTAPSACSCTTATRRGSRRASSSSSRSATAPIAWS